MINWQNIDTVFLDMDGTLLDLHFDYYFWHHYLAQRLSEIKNVPLEPLRIELEQKLNSKRNLLQWYCLDYWSENLDYDLESLKYEIKDKIKPRPHALDFLEFIHEQPQKVWLVTNAHPKIIKLKFSSVPIEQFFDKVVSSHELNAPKEDQNFWHRLQAKLPFDKNQTLFIDDNETVLKSAETYGIKHLLTIDKPDSQRPAKSEMHYPILKNFLDIMPSKISSPH